MNKDKKYVEETLAYMPVDQFLKVYFEMFGTGYIFEQMLTFVERANEEQLRQVIKIMEGIKND
jgi:hypothetical protein